jgi:hypothetical protein
MPAAETRLVYTLQKGTPRPDLDVAIRGALTAVREDLTYISISTGPDDLWPEEVDAELTRLNLPESWRTYLRGPRGGFSDDLDPRNPVEFELALLLAPYVEHAMSISRQSAGEIASYNGGSETRFALTQDQHAAMVRFMTSGGVDPARLVPANPHP